MKATINVYEYKDLDTNAKDKVIYWLDLYPMEYEEEDEYGEITMKYKYFADLDENEIQEHCESNGYLFTREGYGIHHLIEENKNE